MLTTYCNNTINWPNPLNPICSAISGMIYVAAIPNDMFTINRPLR